jgi:hypothetical protein
MVGAPAPEDDGRSAGFLFRFDQPDPDGAVVRRALRSGGRCGVLPFADVRNGNEHGGGWRYVLAGEMKEANGDHSAAFTRYEARMRDYVAPCQKLAEGLDWFIPRTRWKLWLSLQMWRMLPYTPWKNMMIELPAKVGNSIRLEGC